MKGLLNKILHFIKKATRKLKARHQIKLNISNDEMSDYSFLVGYDSVTIEVDYNVQSLKYPLLRCYNC